MKFWSRLNSGNSCCPSVQNLLLSCLSHKNVKIKIYGILIMPALLHEYESWSVILKKVYRLSIFESRALREICEPQVEGRNRGLRKFHNGQLDGVQSSQNIIISIKPKGVILMACTVCGRQGQQTVFFKPEISDHLEHTNTE